MNRNLLLGMALGAVLAGVALVALDGVQTLEAAPGDVTPTTPRTDTGLVLTEVCVSSAPHVRLTWRDGLGASREAIIRNGTSTGFVYADGSPVTVSTPTGFTTLRATLGVTNARITTAVSEARTLGVIRAPGTVQ